MSMQIFKKIIAERINHEIQVHNGNQSRAAIALGISRGTLRKYMLPSFKKGKGVGKRG